MRSDALCSACALVGRLHQAGATACDDVTTLRCKFARHALDLGVAPVPGLRTRRAKDGYAIALALAGSQATEVVDRVPQYNRPQPQTLSDIRITVGNAGYTRKTMAPIRSRNQ